MDDIVRRARLDDDLQQDQRDTPSDEVHDLAI